MFYSGQKKTRNCWIKNALSPIWSTKKVKTRGKRPNRGRQTHNVRLYWNPLNYDFSHMINETERGALVCGFSGMRALNLLRPHRTSTQRPLNLIKNVAHFAAENVWDDNLRMRDTRLVQQTNGKKIWSCLIPSNFLVIPQSASEISPPTDWMQIFYRKLRTDEKRSFNLLAIFWSNPSEGSPTMVLVENQQHQHRSIAGATKKSVHAPRRVGSFQYKTYISTLFIRAERKTSEQKKKKNWVVVGGGGLMKLAGTWWCRGLLLLLVKVQIASEKLRTKKAWWLG